MDRENLQEWVVRNRKDLGRYREYLSLRRVDYLEELIYSKDIVLSSELRGRIKMLDEQIRELSQSIQRET